jgi:hypothetical protein
MTMSFHDSMKGASDTLSDILPNLEFEFSPQYHFLLTLYAIDPSFEVPTHLLDLDHGFPFLRVARYVHLHRFKPDSVDWVDLEKELKVLIHILEEIEPKKSQELYICLFDIIQEFYDEPLFQPILALFQAKIIPGKIGLASKISVLEVTRKAVMNGGTLSQPERCRLLSCL